jgi:predicted dehydrogenase
MPKGCTSVSMHPPFFTATFEYENLAVCYESEIDSVPRFDEHLKVYCANKTLNLEHASLYIKGLPVKVVLDEQRPSGGYQSREILTAYEAAHTSKLSDLLACLAKVKVIKTSIEDAIENLQIFQMILKLSLESLDW